MQSFGYPGTSSFLVFAFLSGFDYRTGGYSFAVSSYLSPSKSKTMFGNRFRKFSWSFSFRELLPIYTFKPLIIACRHSLLMNGSKSSKPISFL